MGKAVIVEAMRTPIGRGRELVGQFNGFHATQLLVICVIVCVCIAQEFLFVSHCYKIGPIPLLVFAIHNDCIYNFVVC